MKSVLHVVIVGAGVAGLSIGWRLLQQGAKVTILERAQPGGGATLASAGMLALAGEMASAPPEEITFARQSNALWPDFAAELEAVSGQSIGFIHSGTLLLGEDADTLAARAAATGLPLLAPEAARARWPMLTGEFAGALWAQGEAHVDTRALGQALTRAFLKAGGVLKPAEAVVNILDYRGQVVGVATPYERYPADAVLVAAGAWSGLVTDVPVTPVKGEMIALTPPDGADFDFGGPMLWGHGVYLVPRAGRLLVGATMARGGFDTSLTDQARTWLRAGANRLVPALANWRLDAHWAGLRPATPDGMPLLGAWGPLPGLYVAAGQYRNGILFAPAIARLMADVLLGRAAVPAALDSRRFQKDKSP